MKASDVCLPSVVRKISLRDPIAVREDSDFRDFLHELEGGLGAAGRIVIRFSGIGSENRIFIEAEDGRLCEDAITKVETYLGRRGYLLE